MTIIFPHGKIGEDINHRGHRDIPCVFQGREKGKHKVDCWIWDEGIVKCRTVETFDKICEAKALIYLGAFDEGWGLSIHFYEVWVEGGIEANHLEATEMREWTLGKLIENWHILCGLCGLILTIFFKKKGGFLWQAENFPRLF